VTGIAFGSALQLTGGVVRPPWSLAFPLWSVVCGPSSFFSFLSSIFAARQKTQRMAYTLQRANVVVRRLWSVVWIR